VLDDQDDGQRDEHDHQHDENDAEPDQPERSPVRCVAEPLERRDESSRCLELDFRADGPLVANATL
jgi:hypothetical protein